MFLVHLRNNYPKILEEIRKTGDLSKDIDNELKNIILTFIPESGLKLKS